MSDISDEIIRRNRPDNWMPVEDCEALRAELDQARQEFAESAMENVAMCETLRGELSKARKRIEELEQANRWFMLAEHKPQSYMPVHVFLQRNESRMTSNSIGCFVNGRCVQVISGLSWMNMPEDWQVVMWRDLRAAPVLPSAPGQEVDNG